MKSQEDLRKGLALLVVTAGGFCIVLGILTMTAAVGAWTFICALVAGAHIPILGPVAIAGGLAALVAGVYAAIASQTPQALSTKAHDTLIDAISKWRRLDRRFLAENFVGIPGGLTKAASENPDICMSDKLHALGRSRVAENFQLLDRQLLSTQFQHSFDDGRQDRAYS